MPKITATRYHDFSYGHRVYGHESKCAHLHGHNGRVHFTVQADNGLDDIGRVLDFSVIKDRLCQWLEENWDHKMLVWIEDPIHVSLAVVDPTVVWVHFNPTAENMAKHLVEEIGPAVLQGTGCKLIKVVFEETTKCCATFEV